ncbi:MAG TPA: DUF4180 domain-containing protein [Firmicutes bacterium]|jgi:PadR family transcriptional regulator AphA|nr:DUF4180 domain-containing protein [Bacillota bacterium]
MNYRVIEINGKKYIEYASVETPIRKEENAIDLISACFEYDTNFLLIQAQALVDDFFKLRTGLAGSVLQKFINYNIKVAVVMTDQQEVKGKFKEFITETNKGNSFRVFSSKEEAENWFMNTSLSS